MAATSFFDNCVRMSAVSGSFLTRPPKTRMAAAIPPLDPAELLTVKKSSAEDQDRGLHFLCLNANISRQFEFVQHTWVNNPHFDELYDDADPVIGTHYPDGGTFTMQAKPARKRLTSLPHFVSVVGGAYFFMPGIKAIRYLANL